MIAVPESFAELRLLVAEKEKVAGIDLGNRIQPLRLLRAAASPDVARTDIALATYG